MSVTPRWRPLHHELSALTLELLGNRPLHEVLDSNVHLGLTTDEQPQRFRTACGAGLGGWVTGRGDQVTCPECQRTVHS